MCEAGVIGQNQYSGHGVSTQNVVLHHDPLEYQHDGHSEKNV